MPDLLAVKFLRLRAGTLGDSQLTTSAMIMGANLDTMMGTTAAAATSGVKVADPLETQVVTRTCRHLDRTGL